jgi:putative hydrolase of the HAD superfamily
LVAIGGTSARFDGRHRARYARRVELTHLIFDLDNTLYPPSLGVVERVDALINRFMVERLAMPLETAARVRARYRNEHGTTLNGLMLHHGIEPDEFLAHVHAIDVEELVRPDAALLAMLESLPQQKIVFTNGSAGHAERVLACLGVRGCFAEVFSLERVAYVPKPSPQAFATVLAAIAAAPPRCLVVDDRVDNLVTARAIGTRTMLVGAAALPPDAVDFVVASVLELPDALAALAAAS